LPPYLIARNARFKDEDEIEARDESKMKRLLRESMQSHAFCTLCLCASIPNPLFDLAGLMAGHFGVPFWEFFLATGIGKALIKVQIQVLIIVVMFSGDFLESIAASLENTFSFLGKSLTNTIKKQKTASFKRKLNEKSLLSYLWDTFIALMVLYFVLSLCNTLVNKEKVRLTQELERGEPKASVSLVKFE